MRSRIAALSLLGLGAACAPRGGPTTDTVTIGAYSVVREAFHEGLLPAFAAQWKARTGRDVWFEESYNASGAQARAIKAGLDVDVAVLSHADDMDLLVRAGLVRPDWDDGPQRGMLTRSLVVIGYRPGNPKGIRDWDDLARPGVGVLYPDPRTSGGARWNVNAIYGAALLRSRQEHGGRADPDEVRRLMARIQANVINMDASGRQSMATFDRGTGDAIVSYENELLLRRRQGREIPYAIPPATLLIESPVAPVEPNIDRHGNREVVRAFLAFLLSPEGQGILAQYGFRPVDPGVPDATGRPLPPKLFTMADLGGWGAVKRQIYGPGGLWDAILIARSREE